MASYISAKLLAKIKCGMGAFQATQWWRTCLAMREMQKMFHPRSGRSTGIRNGIPLQYSCLENPMDRGVWRATVHGVTNSQTWLSTHRASLQNSILTTPGTLELCWEECKMLPPLWKTVWQFLKKLNISLPYNPAILFLGIGPREMKTYVTTKTDVWMFIAALFMSEPRKHYAKWKKPH